MLVRPAPADSGRPEDRRLHDGRVVAGVRVLQPLDHVRLLRTFVGPRCPERAQPGSRETATLATTLGGRRGVSVVTRGDSAMICSARPLLPKFPPEPGRAGRAITAWIARLHSPSRPPGKGQLPHTDCLMPSRFWLPPTTGPPTQWLARRHSRRRLAGAARTWRTGPGRCRRWR